MEDNNRYNEIADQVFNLVDNDKDKVEAFYRAQDSSNEEININKWFQDFVNPDEFQDLLNDKYSQTKEGFMNWVSDPSKGNEYFRDNIRKYNNIQDTEALPNNDNSITKNKIYNQIDDEDSSILTQMSDNDYISSNVDDEDEIDAVLQLMNSDEYNDALETDSSEDDFDIVFDIVDNDNSENEDSSLNTQDTENIENIETSEDNEDNEEKKSHRTKIKLDHHVNKIVEKIDDEESIDRGLHKKYYVLKKKELQTSDKLNELEDDFDKEAISYYDFPSLAIKIYHSNEVQLNRIFEKENMSVRCKDIAHYTDNWNS